MESERRNYERLKRRLETVRQVRLDPVSLVRRCRRKADAEVAGLLVASLAYGRRETILDRAGNLLRRLGPSPARTLARTDFEGLCRRFDGFVHRLNTGTDLALLCAAIGRLRRSYGSLERCFEQGLRRSGGWDAAVAAFASELRERMAAEAERHRVVTGRWRHLVPRPVPGAAKRLNLFLKWMVRKDRVDPGVWAERLGRWRRFLVMPVDVHIAALARRRGITRRSSADWRFAQEVTAWLRRLCPSDPLRYDFCLCHEGMERFRRRR